MPPPFISARVDAKHRSQNMSKSKAKKKERGDVPKMCIFCHHLEEIVAAVCVCMFAVIEAAS